jgi:hypothetical protein
MSHHLGSPIARQPRPSNSDHIPLADAVARLEKKVGDPIRLILLP